MHLAFGSFSPYEDNRLLYVHGTPKMQQYMAVGLMHDHETGYISDIVEISFGG